MTTSRCAYCGAWAENPVRLSWVIAGDEADGPLTADLPLCSSCSNSWCPEPAPCAAACPGDDSR